MNQPIRAHRLPAPGSPTRAPTALLLAFALALLVGGPAAAHADEYLFHMKATGPDVDLAYFGTVASGSDVEVRISMIATPVATDGRLPGLLHRLDFDPENGSLSLTANGHTLDLPLHIQIETPSGYPAMHSYSGHDPDVDGHRFNVRADLGPVVTPAFDDILAFNVVPVYVSSGRMVLLVDLFEQQVELTATLVSIERVEASTDVSGELAEVATAVSLLAESLAGVGPGVALLGPAIQVLSDDVALLHLSVDDLAVQVATRASQASVDALASQLAGRASQTSVDGLAAQLTAIDQRLTTIQSTQLEIDNKVTRVLRRLRRAGIGDETGP